MSVITIVGSRDFNDYEVLKTELSRFDIKKIVTGGAKGADLLAEQYAHDHNIPIEVYKPDSKLGHHASILRNKLMVDDSDAIVVFWNGQYYGTLSTIRHAKKTGKPVSIVNVWNNKFDEERKLQSEYRGLANYAKATEFYLNSTFQEDFKNFSRSLSTPLVGNSKTPSYWFYESVRNEYLSARVNLTVDEQRQFDVENPKNQVFIIFELARNELAWLQEPFIAIDSPSLGKSVLAHRLADMLEKNKLAINEAFFKRAVAMIILRDAIEAIMFKAEGCIECRVYNTIPFIIAYLSYLVSKSGKSFNFEQIWHSQSIPKELEDIIDIISREILRFLFLPKEGYFSLMGGWRKEVACWNQIKALPLDIKLPDSLLIDNEDDI